MQKEKKTQFGIAVLTPAFAEKDSCEGERISGPALAGKGSAGTFVPGRPTAEAAGVTLRVGAEVRQVVADCIESLHTCGDRTSWPLAINGFSRPDGDKCVKMTRIRRLARILQSDL